MVHLWTQQETGRDTFNITSSVQVQTLCLYLSALLWRRPQVQSPRPVPTPIRPRERHHSLVVWLQAHKQPTLLRWDTQAGLHCICSTAWTDWLLNKSGDGQMGLASLRGVKRPKVGQQTQSVALRGINVAFPFTSWRLWERNGSVHPAVHQKRVKDKKYSSVL